jgi:hypothetical protein
MVVEDAVIQVKKYMSVKEETAISLNQKIRQQIPAEFSNAC